MAQQLDRETLDKMVNVMLDYNGTPRHRLFEYPYNDYESRAILQKAETAVRRIVALRDEQR